MNNDILKEAEELCKNSNRDALDLIKILPQVIAEARRWRWIAIEERARGNYFDESQDCEGYSWDRKNKKDYTQNQHRVRAAYELGVEI